MLAAATLYGVDLILNMIPTSEVKEKTSLADTFGSCSCVGW